MRTKSRASVIRVMFLYKFDCGFIYTRKSTYTKITLPISKLKNNIIDNPYNSHTGMHITSRTIVNVDVDRSSLKTSTQVAINHFDKPHQ